MDSAPIFTALFTFSSPCPISAVSGNTKIYVDLCLQHGADPVGMDTGMILLQGIQICPFATYSLTSSASICSYSATACISFVIMPCLAASICVVYTILFSSLFPGPGKNKRHIPFYGYVCLIFSLSVPPYMEPIHFFISSYASIIRIRYYGLKPWFFSAFYSTPDISCSIFVYYTKIYRKCQNIFPEYL